MGINNYCTVAQWWSGVLLRRGFLVRVQAVQLSQETLFSVSHHVLAPSVFVLRRPYLDFRTLHTYTTPAPTYLSPRK